MCGGQPDGARGCLTQPNCTRGCRINAAAAVDCTRPRPMGEGPVDATHLLRPTHSSCANLLVNRDRSRSMASASFLRRFLMYFNGSWLRTQMKLDLADIELGAAKLDLVEPGAKLELGLGAGDFGERRMKLEFIGPGAGASDSGCTVLTEAS